MKIAYTFVISDLFHYGHLQLLEAAANMSDRLICGVLTDDAVLKIGGSPISNYQERSGVIQAIKYVNEVIPQESQDPFDNLQLLRQRFPQDEIIFVYGENWGEAPGGNSLNKINITLKQQSFYKKLTNNHIACKFVEKYYPNLTALDTFSERFVIPDFDKFSKEKPKFTVTTKANTLQKLKLLLKKSHIEKMYVFTIADWNHYAAEVLADIKEKFNGKRIVVRSSCLNEDSMQESKAGHYQSILNIDSQDESEVEQAITKVMHSSPQDEINLSDQILVQRYTEGVQISGVLFTKDLGTNAPYYVVNYSVGHETDTVTSGKQASLIKIFRHIHRRVLQNHWQKLLEAIDEIEHVVPDIPLDIEFAIRNDNEIIIFQVRPLSANVYLPLVDENQSEHILKQQAQNYHQLLLENQTILKGEPLVFSDMAFWNPSELIGCHPSVLAYDLFKLLFMDKAWCYGLSNLAYNKLKPQPLMYKFCNKPYINVNLAFHALLPENIPSQYHAPLNAYYLKKLCAHPYLHDKVEFKVLFTCYDFSLNNRLTELLNEGFTENDTQIISHELRKFTESLIDNSVALFAEVNTKIADLQIYHADALISAKAQRGQEVAGIIQGLLSTCEELGTITFSTVARMAFVAESLIKSLAEINVITFQEYNEIKQSFCTVAYELTKAISDVAKGVVDKSEFMEQYGHLRAGTYDITQCRYDQSEQMLFEVSADEGKHELSNALIEKISAFLNQSPLNISFQRFYNFVKGATESREKVKLVFTKVISDVLEMLKEIGKEHNVLADELAYLELNEILDLRKLDVKDVIKIRKEQFALYKKFALPALITKPEDFMFISSLEAKPNFVTDKVIQGEVVVYHKEMDAHKLQNNIIFIENADPGFHWILAYKIKGIVTRFGGAASHMAICCAELGIPAAIGCGEKYADLIRSRSIRIDCVNETIERIQ